MQAANAEVAELADAHGSGPCGSNTMRVQVSFPALMESSESIGKMFSEFFYTMGKLLSYRIKKDAPLRMRTRAKSRVLPDGNRARREWCA